MNKARLEAFSDGVFSISITLLVLDIKVPNFDSLGNEQLNRALVQALPNILTFVFTFLVVGIFWVAHHRIFTFVKAVDSSLLWINIFYLMLAAIIPFPASILAKHPFLPTAIRLYTGTLLVFGLMHFVFLYYIKRQPQLTAITITAPLFKASLYVAAFGPACYLLAALFSFISVTISFGFVLLPLILYIFFAGRVLPLVSPSASGQAGRRTSS